MTTLLLDEVITKMFERRVSPVLAARGIVERGSTFDQITRYLNEQLRAWSVTIRRPHVGAIDNVDFSRRAPQFLDCHVRVPGLPEEIRREAAVCIRGKFGLTAVGELCNEPAREAPLDDESYPLLALTCREFTLLADVLPGKDCWIAVAVWANELLPMHLVMQRPRRSWSLSSALLEVVALERDGAAFAVVCPQCDGDGRVDCDKCQGTGIHRPRVDCSKCNGRGDFWVTCRKCDGTGAFVKQCRRCGGSGSFKNGTCYGCNGSGQRQFDCNSCSGTGRRNLECRACEGRGYFPQLDCNRCSGFGFVECYPCAATGFLHAKFSHADGSYSIVRRKRNGDSTTQVLTPSEITIFDWEREASVRIRAGAGRMLEEVRDAVGTTRACNPDTLVRIADHCRQLQPVRQCLTESLEAKDLRDTRPVRVGRPEASVSRSHGGVVYEFPVISRKREKWVSEGLLPFPRKTSLQFAQRQEDGGLSPIELLVQSTSTVGGKEVHGAPMLVDCIGRGSEYRLAVRFPVEFDPSSLPTEAYLKPDMLPPPESTQIRHLRRWCSQDNWAHPVLRAIVCSSQKQKPDGPIHFFSTSIASFPRQAEAVHLGLSSHPLGLIKGPPGTGKTTVITEVVRQVLARGQRVLVCSQTHQAVQNVLERLHREGGIRMMRHGHSESLTELEMRYRAGGVEDEYCRSVRTRSHATFLTYQERLVYLDEATKTLPQARDAAARLVEVRRQAMADLQRFAQGRSEELEKAARILAQQREDANANTLVALHDAEERDQRSKRDLLRVQKALRKIERRSDASKRAYTRRTGNAPEVIEVTSTWRKVLRDVFVPSWMASDTTLQERYSRGCHQLSELKPGESSLLNTIRAIAAEVEAIHVGFEQMLAEFTAERDAKVALSEARYTEQSASVACQAEAEEQQLRALQTHGVPFAAAVGLSLTDDSAPELWQAALNEAETDCRNVSERADFLSRWLRDIEAEPSTLEACCWDHIQVFFSTCVGLASWRRLVQQGPNAIDLVIIDEAAHATATETLIPMLYSRRTLLIGDEMQLPPSAPMELDCKARCPVTLSISNEGRQHKPGGGIAAAVEMSPCWLERSYFEWLWRNCSQIPRVMLDTQFRMHPAIAGFVGSVFYPEGLSTAVDESRRTVAFGEFNRPVCLIPTSAYPDRHEEYLDPGYRNRLEAQIVKRVMERAEQELVDAQEFGIITPYAHQVELILREAGKLLPSFQKVRLSTDDIASVDSFQGSERDAIIISFVRSPASCKRCDGTGEQRERKCSHCRGKGWRGTGLTFARDLRRLNVAFSRARKMLILVGDIDALTDSRYRGGAPGSHVLAMFRDYVKDRGKVLHVWERYHDKE